MSFRNIKLIYFREIRDQLRDRRTLFMIAVLPLLMYPLIGMSVFQLSQFLREHESRVLVIGSDQIDTEHLPPLFEDEKFAADMFADPAESGRLQIEVDRTANSQTALTNAQQRLKSGGLQVVVYFPPEFGRKLTELRDAATQQRAGPRSGRDGTLREDGPIEVPEPEILYNTAREKSRIAHHAVERVINEWRAQVVRETLMARRVPLNVARPFQVKSHDVADPEQKEAVVWAKVLPFVLFIWALTGAFYPAVDLCAGEKERGTLETLLSSPALRSEIVWGKLLTVMTFSVATAMLNLSSLGLTARYVVAQLQSITPGNSLDSLSLPPLSIIVCLFAALLPMAALFSALCLACAAFARSTKEGQYYLMPLLLVMMPLMLLPMSPGIELNLGNSLIPVTGVVLLLRRLVEGNIADALPYIIPVCGMTLICCLLAIRWAIYQFNQESVLFRESERLDLRRWIVHLVRERQETPTLAEAFFCVALIFVVQFFTRLAITAHVPENPGFGYLAELLFISQVVCIALPALLMTVMFTRNRLKTLLLDRAPAATACVAAVVLAVVVQPLGQQLTQWIQELYPIQKQVLADTQAFARLLETAPYVWLPFVLMALLPAICEEVAFRGFILSGLRHVGHKWWAIALSAVFFGFAHTVVQQSLVATVLGLLLGYIAVQSSSLVPCILFHVTYNSVMLSSAILPKHWTSLAERFPAGRWIFAEGGDGLTYHGPMVILSAVLSAGILAWFHRLPYLATKEEKLSDARAMQAQQLAAGSAE